MNSHFKLLLLRRFSFLLLAALLCSLAGLNGKDRSVVTDEDRQFWSFQPLKKTSPPLVDNSWAKSPIDGYVFRKLQQANQRPSPETTKRVWLRRVSYSLTGLPPTLGELAEFEADGSREAHARVVDRLLSSRHYGEHWASHWLDGVRYVQEVGYYNFTNLGWRYRDWVIRSLNNDMPYDDFIVHQLAGDLLPNPNGENVYGDGLVATGFLCMGNYDDQESDKDRLYSEVADDQIDVVTRQFLGLTVSCARCHDHKFDPIPTSDYYAMAGIFMSTRVLDTRSRIGANRLKVRMLSDGEKNRRNGVIRERDELQKQFDALTDKTSHEARRMERRLDALKAKPLPEDGEAMSAQEGAYSNSRLNKVGDMPIYLRGDYRTPGKVVPRGVLSVIAGKHAKPIGERTKQSGRLELAKWIADPENPLTARVMANRVWQHHLGQAIVRTPNNFGALGQAPTHPELLDWLAKRFIDSGWSLKKLHRDIVLSATYRQESNVPESVAADPENKLFGRFDRRRLTAEEVHDSLLFVSDRLKPTKRNGHEARAVYTHTGHLKPWRFGQLFDSPATGTIMAKRDQSTSAPQSLFMLNDSAAINAARGLAGAVGNRHKTDQARLNAIYQTLYTRPPTADETKWAMAYLKQTYKPWTLYHVLLCANEFLHVE